jgi:uncharacterized LabA/DUF88 family protein
MKAPQMGKKKPPIPREEKGGSNGWCNLHASVSTRKEANMSLETSVVGARTIVFVDYQNMYRSAREAFDWEAKGGHYGNFRPYGLGRQMVRGGSRTLTQVRVYTGIHTPQHNAPQHGQMQRRMMAWVAEAPDKIQVFPRPLRYGADRPPQEKGVDVELAIDLVALALDDAFDVAVLASADSDLVPALQFVADRFAQKHLVTVAYEPLPNCCSPAPLDLPRGHVERRWITKRDFDRMADRVNFYESTSDRTSALDPERVARIRRRYAPRPEGSGEPPAGR